MKTYKGFNKDFKCRGFQYEVGKTYTHDGKVKVCESGFHACTNPIDVWSYYGPNSRFAIVEAEGSINTHDEDSKIVSSRITIVKEISLAELIAEINRYYSKLAESGDYSKLAASGYGSNLAASGHSSNLAASGHSSNLAASGDYSKLAASGDYSKLAASGYGSNLAASGHISNLAASGHSSNLVASGHNSNLAASGDYSKLAASGYGSNLAASGDNSICMAAGTGSKGKVGKNGALALSWHDGKRRRISTAYEGENGIKAGIWYTLDENGNFIEVGK